MLAAWLAAGAEPLAFCGDAGSNIVTGITEELQSLGLGDALVHGIPNGRSPVGVHCFFGFIAISCSPQRREREIVHAIVPHAFGAYCRALTGDRPPNPIVDAAPFEAMITDREVEILRWVREGKSNQEIGLILSISPLTVKNHVQKILRKLRASNRTQAVSKAISLRLLGATVLPGARPGEQLIPNG
jgi:DNA-binding CsgD family transcriptional regulator